MPLGKVAIDRLLQGRMARIVLGCGKPVLRVPTLAVRWAHHGRGRRNDPQSGQRDRMRGKRSGFAFYQACGPPLAEITDMPEARGGRGYGPPVWSWAVIPFGRGCHRRPLAREIGAQQYGAEAIH